MYQHQRIESITQWLDPGSLSAAPYPFLCGSSCPQALLLPKTDYLAFAYEFYEQYVADYRDLAKVPPYLVLPLSYVDFAQKETLLFHLLFIHDMDLDMTKANDFYQEADNEKKAEIFSKAIGIDLERTKKIYLDLFLYTHGIAVLTATKKLSFDRENAEKMVMDVLTALILQEIPHWNGSNGANGRRRSENENNPLFN